MSNRNTRNLTCVILSQPQSTSFNLCVLLSSPVNLNCLILSPISFNDWNWSNFSEIEQYGNFSAKELGDIVNKYNITIG